MAATDDLSWSVSAAVAGASSSVMQVPSWQPKSLDVTLQVTAATGGTTPAVQAEVKWSFDGATFVSADSTPDYFPDNTNTGLRVGASAVKEFEVKAPYWRIDTTFSGAPTNMTYRIDTRYTQ